MSPSQLAGDYIRRHWLRHPRNQWHVWYAWRPIAVETPDGLVRVWREQVWRDIFDSGKGLFGAVPILKRYRLTSPD